MEDPPKDPRVIAMLSALFGGDWEKLEGDVAFDKAPMESWVVAMETMLGAADAADPIRVAIRGLMQEDSTYKAGPAMPSRSE